MSVGVGGAIAIGGGLALGGGLAGYLGDQNSQTNTSGLRPGSLSQLGQMSQADLQRNLEMLGGYTNAGAGMNDISGAASSQRSLADLFNQYSQNGGMPTQSQIGQAQGYAQSIFDPQRLALQQSYQTAQTDTGRLAGQLGRSVDDPILNAKLQLGHMQQRQQLESQQGAFGSQMALQMPGRSLEYASQANQLRQQLASQAFSNRYQLAGLGSNIFSNAQNYQLATAQHYGDMSQQIGGGWGGALKGFIGGAGGGFGAMSKLGAFGGGGGGLGGGGMGGWAGGDSGLAMAGFA